MFKSHNPIKKFSLEIAHSICEDLTQPIDLLISSGEITSEDTYPYGLIVDDLNLYDNILHVINSYCNQLNKKGILIMNILGGDTLHQLVQSMMQADLLKNRLVTRILPKISAEGLLSLANKSSFKYKTVMSSTATISYPSVSAVIQSLREIKLTKKLSNNQPTSRKYWQSVQEIFSDLHKNLITIEVITLLAVK